MVKTFKKSTRSENTALRVTLHVKILSDQSYITWVIFFHGRIGSYLSFLLSETEVASFTVIYKIPSIPLNPERIACEKVFIESKTLRRNNDTIYKEKHFRYCNYILLTECVFLKQGAIDRNDRRALPCKKGKKLF